MKTVPNQRTFIGYYATGMTRKAPTAAATAGLAAQTVVVPNADRGKKGKICPGQRRKYRDSRTGQLQRSREIAYYVAHKIVGPFR